MSVEVNEPTFFAGEQLALVTAIADRLIPSDGDLPGAGAGAGGVAAFLDGVVAQSAELKALFGRGLARVEIETRARRSRDFIDLSDGEKDKVLRSVETAEPAFFSALVRQTYNGYYTNAKVLELLRLEPQPPQPQGHELAQGDLRLLESVKSRGRAYREA